MVKREEICGSGGSRKERPGVREERKRVWSEVSEEEKSEWGRRMRERRMELEAEARGEEGGGEGIGELRLEGELGARSKDFVGDVEWVADRIGRVRVGVKEGGSHFARALLRWVNENARNRGKFFEVLMPKVWSLVERREEEEEEGRRERMKVEEVRRILEGWREAGKGAGVMGDEWVVEAVREEERRGE